jgi:hypothetical protein
MLHSPTELALGLTWLGNVISGYLQVYKDTYTCGREEQKGDKLGI